MQTKKRNPVDLTPSFRGVFGAALVIASWTLLASCSGRGTVDDRVRAMLTDAKARTNAAVEPRERESLYGTGRSPGELSTRPSTTNPAAEELTFTAADEARDLSARLRMYAADGGLNVTEGDDAVQRLFTPPEGVRVIALAEAFKLAQQSGREYRSAEEELILAAIRLLSERHLWGPRLFNDTTVGLFGSGDDGRFEHTAELINQLRATQRLPYGGSVEAAWIVRATDQLREQSTGGYRQSSALVLGGNIPLLRGAGQVAREDLIQSERSLVYQAREFERFRRRLLVSIASDYFAILQTRASIANQLRQLRSLRELVRAAEAKVEAGRVEAFDKDIASNRVQSALSTLSNLVDRYIFQIERFKVRLGVPLSEPVALADDIIELPDPGYEPVEATQMALDFRLDLQNQRDRIDDSRRTVANAKNGLLPDLNFSAGVEIPTDPREDNAGLNFSGGDLDYRATAILSLPLDREIDRLRLRSAIIGLERQIRNYQQSRDEAIIGVRDAMRSVDNARFQLVLAEEQVRINRRRLRGQQLQIDTIDTQALVDTENDLLQAENESDRARTALRNAVLNFLLEADVLRVAPDGSFQLLPGMVMTPTPTPPQPDPAQFEATPTIDPQQPAP
jgi:outer membrane protein TolC